MPCCGAIFQFDSKGRGGALAGRQAGRQRWLMAARNQRNVTTSTQQHWFLRCMNNVVDE